jgi:hypothetical protein
LERKGTKADILEASVSKCFVDVEQAHAHWCVEWPRRVKGCLERVKRSGERGSAVSRKTGACGPESYGATGSIWGRVCLLISDSRLWKTDHT